MALDALQSSAGQLSSIIDLLHDPFWKRGDFWIGTVLSLGGLIFSIGAYREASRATRAAKEAGRSVKIQTTTVELTEVAQKLDRIQPKIHFNEARDLFNEISRRIRRVIAPFARDTELKESIEALKDVLQLAKAALASVRPTDAAKEIEVPDAVYYAMEAHFGAISDAVADLLGLFEKKGFDFGDDDGNS